MTNILPIEQRVRVRRATYARFIQTTALVLIGSACVSILALIPAFVTIYVPSSALEETAVNQKEAEVQAEADRIAAGKTRTLLAELSSVREEPVMTPLIESILSAQPPGVTVVNLSLRPGAPGTITVSGKAPDRRDIEAYREALVDTGLFNSVTVPVAALVGALSGSFTMTITAPL